jgi:molybdopterin-guanine dinucleotide biosynthesis protein A
MIYKAENISGVILAGGENNRFGGFIKSNIIIEGSTILKRITNSISEIFGEIIIVTNTPEEFNICSGCRFISDEYSGKGPLGGIHSGMKASERKSIFVFAGDMPFLDNELIMNQIKHFYQCGSEALIPRIKERIEPLHSIYSNSLFPKLDRYLRTSSKFAVRDFIENVNVSYMELTDNELMKKAFTNINTPDEAAETAGRKNREDNLSL